MAAPPRAPRSHRGIAFAAGLGFAVVPAFGPFLALLAVLAGRLELQRADRWWWACALLIGGPWVLGGHVLAGALATAQVLAVWLIFRSATALRQAVDRSAVPEAAGGGLVLGLAVTLVLGFQHMGGIRWDALTVLDAIIWQGNPALFGHALLVLSVLLAIVVPSPRLRAAALALGGVGVLLSGAREAMLVWLVLAVGLRLLRRGGRRDVRVFEWALIVVVAAVGSGLGTLLGLGRSGFVTDLVATTAGPNMLRGTEIEAGDWWHHLGVTVTTGIETVGGEPRTVYSVTKAWPEAWARLQQVVTLEPGETYTISALVRAAPDGRPGLDGWGRAPGGDRDSVLASTLVDGVLRASGSGGVLVLASEAAPHEGGWTRLAVTFRYDGGRPVTWYTGAVVDRSERSGVRTDVAELQLTPSSSPLPYAAGVAERGADLRNSRFPIWRDAIDAIAQRPMLGWGPDGLPAAMASMRPEEPRIRPVAAHAHNALLAVWVERGAVGVLGVLGLVALLALRAVQQRDRAAALVVAGVVALNLFDATLLSGSVIYPLAAVLGWRAWEARNVPAAETGLGSAAAVRAGLAIGDLAAGAAALTLAAFVAHGFDLTAALIGTWSVPLAYAALAWPAAAWWSGLYPGYGLPSHVVLARSVRAAAAAALVVGFVALVFPDALGLTGTVVALTATFGVVLAPATRALVTLALRKLRLWGRRVAVLGTGAVAARVVRHLLTEPTVGLHPVVAFGSAEGWPLSDPPLAGGIEDAWSYLDDERVRHVLVAPDASTELGFDEILLRANRHVRYVQFMPELHGLPAASVTAAPLGAALALEVGNQLASSTNRAIKRALDVFGASVTMLLLGPLMLVIGLLIRLDSRGGALYGSERVGRDGATFRCLKFRTMPLDAEERLTDLLGRDERLRAEYLRFHKLRHDPRVTGLGRWLRRTSLDELPQLINVLRGDMSLVGPRPYLVRELDAMGPERELVFLARPGLTGYWQVSGRNDVTFEERLVMEAHYVRNWSVWWDIELLLRTLPALGRRTGA